MALHLRQLSQRTLQKDIPTLPDVPRAVIIEEILNRIRRPPEAVVRIEIINPGVEQERRKEERGPSRGIAIINPDNDDSGKGRGVCIIDLC